MHEEPKDQLRQPLVTAQNPVRRRWGIEPRLSLPVTIITLAATAIFLGNSIHSFESAGGFSLSGFGLAIGASVSFLCCCCCNFPLVRYDNERTTNGERSRNLQNVVAARGQQPQRISENSAAPSKIKSASTLDEADFDQFIDLETGKEPEIKRPIAIRAEDAPIYQLTADNLAKHNRIITPRTGSNFATAQRLQDGRGATEIKGNQI